MNLIICATLVNPPTEGQAFRTFTMMANRRFEVLLEVDHEFQDIYWKWMKDRGLHDFVKELVIPEWQVYGTKVAPPRVERITVTNLHSIIGKFCC